MSSDSRYNELRWIDLRTVPPITPIPANIYDKHGRVVAPVGALLNIEQIAALIQIGGGYVGPDWPRLCEAKPGPPSDSASPRGETAGDARLWEDVSGNPNQRTYLAKLSVEIEEQASGGVARRRTLSTVLKTSSGGFSFECDGTVRSGSIVVAAFEQALGTPCITGAVKRCAPLEGGRSCVFVEFTSASQRSGSGS